MRSYTVSIINDIRKILEECYKKDDRKSYPIIKEIIQNTDDSGAPELIFGWTHGLSDASHPLLRDRPAIFFLNKGGDFTKDDDDAIGKIGMDAKSSDRSTIGKFGLGQKSVFHICDAFFFLGRGEGTNPHVCSDMINPFMMSGEDKDEHHPDWNVGFENDSLLIRRYLQDYFSENGSYFILWLPLRLESDWEDKGKKKIVIKKESIADKLNEIFHDRLQTEICYLLPLLKSLKRVSYIKPDDNDTGFIDVFSIEIKGDRRKIDIKEIDHWESEVDTKAEYFDGKLIQYDKVFSYYGFEKIISIPGFHIKFADYWPTTQDLYGEDERDKSVPHFSVIFIKSSSQKRQAKLSIKWAVFLPLSDGFEEHNINGNHDYTILVHGYFFLNSCRSKLVTWNDVDSFHKKPENAEEVKKIWNKILSEKGIFPEFLFMLQKFIKDSDSTSEDIENLSKGIRDSELFSQNNENICEANQWIYALTPKGGVWSLVSRDTLLLPLPPSPAKSKPRRPWQALNLAALPDGTALIDSNQPNLLANYSLQWPNEQLRKVLDIDVSTVFNTPVLLKYFVEFLRNVSCAGGAVQERLREILRTVFRSLDYTDLDKSSLQRVIKKLNADSRVAIDKPPAELFRELSKCDTNLLLIPKELEPNDKPGTGKPEERELVGWLKVLDRFSGKADYLNACVDASGKLLKLLDDKQRKVFLQGDLVSGLRILRGYDCRKERHLLVSSADITKCHAAGTLFCYSQGTTEKERAGSSFLLQAVLLENRILLINKDTADLLGIQITQCDAVACLRTLGQDAKTLGSPEARGNLIQRLNGEALDDETRIRAMRYLLHGDAEHFENADEPLWVRAYQQNPVWEKLWLQLNQGKSEPWNLLKPELLELVPRGKWTTISIREIQAQEVLQELKSNISSLQPEAFSLEERELILAEVPNKEFWYSLPLHISIDGRMIAVSENAYLATGEFESELASSVVLIKPSNHERVLRQQERWLKSLTPKNILTIILNHETPHLFYIRALDELIQLDKSSTDLNDLEDDLRHKKWLFSKAGKPVAPKDVIYLPKLQEDVIRLLSHVNDDEHWEPNLLAHDILDHQFYCKLQSYFADEQESLGLLGNLLRENSDYWLGKIEVKKSEELSKVAESLKNYPEAKGWHILAQAINAYDAGDCHYKLFPLINQDIQLPRIIRILHWLSEQGNDKNIIFAFNCYLSIYTKKDPTYKKLSSLKLLNSDDNCTWVQADNLCLNYENISRKFILDKEQIKILFNLETTEPKENRYSDNNSFSHTGLSGYEYRKQLTKQFLSTPQRLKLYFENWDGLVHSEMIGVFLSLLGNNEDTYKLAERFLGNHSVEWVREHLPRHIDFDRFVFAFEDIKAKKISVASITNKYIQAPISKNIRSIIVGDYDTYYRIEGIKEGVFPLRILSLPEPSKVNLSELLKSSCEYLLKVIYKKPHSLNMLWEELEETEQFDIEVTRSLILDTLPEYIQRLGAHKANDSLHELIYEWDEARTRIEEYRKYPDKQRFEVDKKQKAVERLGKLVTCDNNAQLAVLEAVKRLIREHYHYEPTSVPFEIFQNADDAVNELLTMREKSVDTTWHEPLPILQTFVLQIDSQRLLFMHWGRLLNDYGKSETFRKQGFHQDLQKILKLSASDKQYPHGDSETATQVTGKFGLGFKSLFLVCNKPQIVSGRLALEIVGGLLPQKLDNAKPLRELLAQKNTDRSSPGTLITAQINQDHSPRDICDRFTSYAGYLAVFAREIRRIEVANKVFQWQPELLGNGIESGQIQGFDESFQALYFRYAEGGILLRLGADGFQALPKDVPKFWVLAPTHEDRSGGFAVNAQFDVDAGRTSLSATSVKNQEIAQKMGRQFGDGLCYLFQHGRDALITKLRSGLSDYDLWHSLWQVLTSVWGADERISSLLRGILCEKHGLGRLISEYLALPSGLPGDYQVLTMPKNILYVISGKLAEAEAEFLTAFARLQVFKNKVKPGQAISGAIKKDLQKILPEFAQTHRQWMTLTLAEALEWLVEEDTKRITKDVAQILGVVLTREFLASYKIQDQKEAERLTKVLRKLEFKTCDETWIVADSLLAGHQQGAGVEEEVMRAAFAPDNFTLSVEYADSALSFFLVCRDKMDAPVEKMQEWVLSADKDKKKKAALHYLLDGELGEKVAKQLRSRSLDNTWLHRSQLDFSSPLLAGWSQKHKEELIYRRLTTELNQFTSSSPLLFPVIEEVEESLDPEVVLHEIYQKWQINGEQQLLEYERNIYPHGSFPSLSDVSNDPENRKNWLTVLTLGACHTIGLVQDYQHKGFIQNCERRQWWETFANVNPKEQPEEWIDVLDDYIGVNEYTDRQQYSYWMRLFPTIYRIARFMDEYIELFYKLNEKNHHFNLRVHLVPRENSDSQGGGIDAASLDRSLGLGACFVTRELVRKGIVKCNPVITPYCYVPVKSTRKLTARMGCRLCDGGTDMEKSKLIHAFLVEHLGEERATFNGAFDIPLQLWAESEGS